MEDKIYYAFTPHIEPILRPWGNDKEFTTARATIAMRKVGNYIYHGTAVCSEGDNFNKAFGKQLAKARMEAGTASKFLITEVMKTRFEDENSMMLYYLNSMTDAIAKKVKTTQRKIGQGSKSKETHDTVTFTKD